MKQWQVVGAMVVLAVMSGCSECEKCETCGEASATTIQGVASSEVGSDEVGALSGEVKVKSDGSRTLIYEGKTIRVDKNGELEVLGPQGKSEVVVNSEGKVTRSNRDIKVTDSSGTEKVYQASSNKTVTYEEYVRTVKTTETRTINGVSSVDSNTTIERKTVETSEAEEQEEEEDDDDDDADDDDRGEKVTICHRPPGNPANQKTLTVGQSAVDAHLRNHPDHVGPCKEPYDGPGKSKGKSKGKKHKGKKHKGKKHKGKGKKH